MFIGGTVLDLSNVICPEGEPFGQSKGAVFLVHSDKMHNPELELEYFQICWGADAIENNVSGCFPLYLAIRRRDGGYWLTRAEKYTEERKAEHRWKRRALDLRKLPDELGGIRLQKASDFHVTPETRSFNQWRTGFFLSNHSEPNVWRFEECQTDRILKELGISEKRIMEIDEILSKTDEDITNGKIKYRPCEELLGCVHISRIMR